MSRLCARKRICHAKKTNPCTPARSDRGARREAGYASEGAKPATETEIMATANPTNDQRSATRLFRGALKVCGSDDAAMSADVSYARQHRDSRNPTYVWFRRAMKLWSCTGRVEHAMSRRISLIEERRVPESARGFPWGPSVGSYGFFAGKPMPTGVQISVPKRHYIEGSEPVSHLAGSSEVIQIGRPQPSATNHVSGITSEFPIARELLPRMQTSSTRSREVPQNTVSRSDAGWTTRISARPGDPLAWRGARECSRQRARRA
jgi:hypothetical protein